VLRTGFGIILAALFAVGCAQSPSAPTADEGEPGESALYKIGPGDQLTVFVRDNPDLTRQLTVRPDGRITVPLVGDMRASQQTPVQLADNIETELTEYIKSPIVNVIVHDFKGTFDQQVRVVGAATEPQAIPYRAGMSVLDVLIAVGGLTEFADGNDAKLVRQVDGSRKTFNLRLEDLLNNGDIDANVPVEPGDVIIIPRSLF